MGKDDVLWGPRVPHWICHCGRAGADSNWACRTTCRGCGRTAPGSVLHRAKAADKKARDEKKDADAQKAKSKGSGGKEKSKLEQQHEKEIKKLKDKLKEQEEELREAKAKESGGDSVMEIEEDGLGQAVSEARKRLKEFKEMAESVKEAIGGGYDAGLAARQVALDAALAAKRAANPLNKQLEGAESHKARMLKKVAEEKEVLEEKQLEVAEATKQLELQRLALAEAEKKAAEATAEVADLAAKYALERKGTATNPEEAKPTDPNAVPTDCVLRSFAERAWQEREAGFAQQIEQLNAIITAAQAGGEGTGSVAAPSVAGDLGSLEDLEDDDRWAKVESSKRKAILKRATSRKTYELATAVQGQLRKVNAVRSPFGKK